MNDKARSQQHPNAHVMRSSSVEKKEMRTIICGLLDCFPVSKKSFDEQFKNPDFTAGVLMGIASVLESSDLPAFLHDQKNNAYLITLTKEIIDKYPSYCAKSFTAIPF